VLIWLNGPFGVGKSCTAEALVRRLPNALLFDPEPLGLLLRQIVRSIDPVDDFQDVAPWRALVVETIRALLASYVSTVVMPMTVWRRDYFDELISALRRVDNDVRCFRLTAAESVLHARILDSDPADGPNDWRLAHLPAGLALIRDTAFGEEIQTDDRCPEHVAKAILLALGDKQR
jgi:hypothetical protein